MTLRWLTRRPGRRSSTVALAAVALTTAWSTFASPAALASPAIPTPGSPGSQYFPAMSPGTFATPRAAARVKFRWWQPAADTNDAEIASMAGNFAVASSRTASR